MYAKVERRGRLFLFDVVPHGKTLCEQFRIDPALVQAVHTRLYDGASYITRGITVVSDVSFVHRDTEDIEDFLGAVDNLEA